jgi:toxin ParE1/3/4
VTIRGVKTTPIAEADLDEIWLYIAADSVTRADKFIDALTERFVTLSRSPRAGRSRPEIEPGLRSFSFRNYVIFYSLTEEGLVIERVLHGSRDIEAIFRKS